MTKKNETVVKIAQTVLMAALCFVSFQFLQFKIVLPGGRAVFPAEATTIILSS